jgi:hypothetical protein
MTDGTQADAAGAFDELRIVRRAMYAAADVVLTTPSLMLIEFGGQFHRAGIFSTDAIGSLA